MSTATKSKPTDANKVDIQARNRDILKMRDSGDKFSKIANKHGITTSRAVQIVKRMRLANPRQVTVSKADVADKFQTTPEKLEIKDAPKEAPTQKTDAPAPAASK